MFQKIQFTTLPQEASTRQQLFSRFIGICRFICGDFCNDLQCNFRNIGYKMKWIFIRCECLVNTFCYTNCNQIKVHGTNRFPMHFIEIYNLCNDKILTKKFEKILINQVTGDLVLSCAIFTTQWMFMCQQFLHSTSSAFR